MNTPYTYSNTNSIRGAFTMSSTGRTTGGGEQTAYRIGQNRIISSSTQQPKMAEIAMLTTMDIGATDVYSDPEPMCKPIRRVTGDDHMPDPSYSPVGDMPWLLFAVMIVAYVARRTWRIRRA